MRTLLSIIVLLIFFLNINNLQATDYSLSNCHDGIKNGQETGIDCGGPDCPPCYCTDTRLYLEDYITDDNFVRSASEWILLDENVMLESTSNITFKAANCINIDRNFEIELGSETLLTIENCIEPNPYPFSESNLLSRDNCGTQFEEMSVGTDICDTNRPDLMLRLNLFVIRNDNGSGGITQSSYNTMINELRFTFDPHRIFFDICLIEILNSSILNQGPISDNIDFLISNYASSSAINGFLFPFGTTNYAGMARGIPSKYFWSNTQEFTLTHEIGHCLGLYHTHMGYFSLATNSETCSTDICSQERVARPDDCDGICPPSDCSSCEPNCAETGDYVCDTPPDFRDCQDFTLVNGILNYPTWSNDCQETYISNNIVPLNVMSYWSNRTSLTEGQACRAYTTSIDYHKDAIINGQPVVINSNFIVAQDIVLNNDHIFNGNIIIDAGAKLTFNGIRAEFSPNSRIITNTSALNNDYFSSSITIQNSVLVPTCGEQFWFGFDLEEGTQFEVLNSSIINARVIDASFNLSTVNDNIPSLYSIHNSKLENSPLYLNHIDGLVDLTDTDFIRTKPSLYPLVLIDGDDMSNALIRDCTFLNDRVSNDTNADGLILTDIGFASIGNSFDNFDIAAKIGTILKAPSGASIRQCTFTNNYIGIEASVYTGLNIVDNTFNIGQVWDNLTQDHTGVFLNFCSDYQIEQNIFRRGFIGADRKGLIIKDGGSDFEVVRDNSFNGLNEAILALGQNREMANDGSVGLEFTCNNMVLGSISETDILVTDEGVQRQQGNELEGAGNSFSLGNFSDPQSSIKMLSNTDMLYFRAVGGFTNNPDFIDPLKINIISSLQSGNCIGSNLVEDERKNVESESLTMLIKKYLELRKELEHSLNINRDAVIGEMRNLNLKIKSLINEPNYILSESEKHLYWTEYKTSELANRKAYIDGFLQNEDTAISEIYNLSVSRYTDDLDYDNFVKIIKFHMINSKEFDSILYENILTSLELQGI